MVTRSVKTPPELGCRFRTVTQPFAVRLSTVTTPGAGLRPHTEHRRREQVVTNGNRNAVAAGFGLPSPKKMPDW